MYQLYQTKLSSLQSTGTRDEIHDSIVSAVVDESTADLVRRMDSLVHFIHEVTKRQRHAGIEKATDNSLSVLATSSHLAAATAGDDISPRASLVIPNVQKDEEHLLDPNSNTNNNTWCQIEARDHLEDYIIINNNNNDDDHFNRYELGNSWQMEREMDQML